MISPERRYAEEAAVILETMGLARAHGKLLAWLLVCDPPQQSSAQLAQALDLSAGSVSTGTRLLENAGLIRRVAVPGARGKVFEVADDAFLRTDLADRISVFRQLMDRGLAVIGGADAEHAGRARRLRRTRDYYAFMEREVPAAVQRFHAEYGAG